MPWLPDAVEGALIAGGVSLAGLLITNQSKVSEFRQEWINALRDDVASLVTHALQAHAAQEAEVAVKINEAVARIRLRLNPKEEESKAILAAMLKLRGAVYSATDFDQVKSGVEELISATQVVLKKEWSRVKTGEPFYRWTFRVVVAGVLLLVLVVLYQKHQWLLHFFSVGK
jgi:CHASE3 domain sensor protein